jgi:hypothetical protein
MAERRQPSLQSIRDHDLLIRLDQKVDQVSVDIKDLKDGTSKTVSDHESRLRDIEEKKIPAINSRMAYWSGAIAVIILLIEFYSHYHH